MLCTSGFTDDAIFARMARSIQGQHGNDTVDNCGVYSI